jgi:hypothetical protein
MRSKQTERVREVSAEREAEGAPVKRLPRRDSTQQMHQRLLRALRDGRIKFRSR